MVIFLSSNSCIPVSFENIHLKLSAQAYFDVHFQSILSKYEKILKIDFYDIITINLK